MRAPSFQSQISILVHFAIPNEFLDISNRNNLLSFIIDLINLQPKAPRQAPFERDQSLASSCSSSEQPGKHRNHGRSSPAAWFSV
jgi:hypothetical protein